MQIVEIAANRVNKIWIYKSNWVKKRAFCLKCPKIKTCLEKGAFRLKYQQIYKPSLSKNRMTEFFYNSDVSIKKKKTRSVNLIFHFS